MAATMAVAMAAKLAAWTVVLMAAEMVDKLDEVTVA